MLAILAIQGILVKIKQNPFFLLFKEIQETLQNKHLIKSLAHIEDETILRQKSPTSSCKVHFRQISLRRRVNAMALFRWNCGVVATKEHSRIMFIPAKKKYYRQSATCKNSALVLCQLLGASWEKNLLNIPDQYVLIKWIHFGETPYRKSAKIISLCWIEPYAFAISSHIVAKDKFLDLASFRAVQTTEMC